MTKAIMINPSDNTATLFGEARAGDMVRIVGQSGDVMEEIKASEHIPVGHKIAVREIGEGERVIKYGQPIGATTQAIRKGEHVHAHNVVSLIFPGPPFHSA